jgi:hypothetical protein
VPIGFIADYSYRHMPANKINSTLVGKLFITGFRSDYMHLVKRMCYVMAFV